MTITLTQEKMGDELKWFAVIDKPGVQERFWIFHDSDIESIVKILKDTEGN